MAIQNRRGYEADFDPAKMLPGEWAVSLDSKYVRMCFAPGECLRMATYEGFEQDMEEVRRILAECKTIEDAVTAINTQVSANASAVVEYTEQAKSYMESASVSAANAKTSETNTKTFATNAKASETNAKVSEENAQRVFESLPEDYTELSRTFYNTAIKNTASGETIHLTDSADSKVVAFALYGKAEQNGIPSPDAPVDIEVAGANGSVKVVSHGKNWLNNLLTSQTSNGVEFTVNNKDKTITLNGTSTAGISLVLYNNPMVLPKGEYKLTIGYGDKGLSNGYPLLTSTTTYKDGSEKNDHLNHTKGVVAIGDDIESVRRFRLYIQSGMTFNNLKIYPMLLKAEDNDEYEPYKETTATISTPNGLVSVGDVYDEIIKYADGSGKGIQKFKHVVYDGVNVAFSNKSGSTANNIFYTNGLTSDSKRVETANTIANIMSSHFKASNTNDGYYNNSVCVYCNPSYSLIYFGFGLDSRFDTLDKVNAWLTENPVDLWYELATPIETDLTAEEIAEIEKLHTFYPVTNISNDADCGMSVTYLCDAKNYIDNKLALIERAMVNNI